MKPYSFAAALLAGLVFFSAAADAKAKTDKSSVEKKAKQNADDKTAKKNDKGDKKEKWQPEIKIGMTKDGKTIIKTVKIEDYLKNVLPKEIPTDWPTETMKAQAVAARTFALKNRGRHAKDGYDLCTGTHCQVYEENVSAPSGDAAIDATRGEVIVYGEKLIDALFHTDSGGMTENSEEVWGGELPYLRAVKEADLKTGAWTKKFAADKFVAAVGVDTVKKLELSRLEIGKAANDRTTSGRVKTMRIVGRKTTKTLSGNELRSIFSLPSTLFDAKIDGKEIIFSGFGAGHGLGMSQYGAKLLGATKDYREILKHYYKNTEIKKLY